MRVGESLGLPPGRLRHLAAGGLLHDVGKLSISDEILKKPGPLTEPEFRIVRGHPEHGYRLLGELGSFPEPAQLGPLNKAVTLEVVPNTGFAQVGP